jgi:hypothetical protein
MSKDNRSILEDYLEALYREVLEFYKYSLLLPREAVKDLVSTMLQPPKGFYKVFQPEEISRALLAMNNIKRMQNDIIDAVRNATRYLVTKRSFEVEESSSISGAIIWPLTIKNILSFRPPAIATYTRALSEPEYMLLKSLVIKAINILKMSRNGIGAAIEKTKQNPLIASAYTLAPKSFITLADYVLNEIDSLLTTLKILIDYYPLKFVHVPKDVNWSYIEKLIRVIRSKPWRPKWVEKTIRLSQSIKNLEESLNSLRNVVELLHKRLDKDVLKDILKTVRFLAFRLYEIYTYMVTLAAVLKVFKCSIEEIEARSIRIEYNYGKSIIVVYGEKPGRSMIEDAEAKWLTGEVINKNELTALAGKPDIGVYNGVKVIIEAKFSNTPSYLTQARFKTLAYIYEYNADAGILVYPGPITGRGMDDEEQETVGILEAAKEKGGLEITLKTDKKLIILPLPPTETEINIEKMTRILASLLS